MQLNTTFLQVRTNAIVLMTNMCLNALPGPQIMKIMSRNSVYQDDNSVIISKTVMMILTRYHSGRKF